MTALGEPLEALLPPLLAGRRRAALLLRRRRRRRSVAVAVSTGLVLAGSALAAIAYLGQPAPPSVKKAFRADNAAKAAFSDVPAPLPLVNVQTARTVAVSGDTILYGAQGVSGNYCTVLLRNGKPVRTPSVWCEFGVYPKEMRVQYERIVTPREETAPLAFSGHLSINGRTLDVRYANGLVDRVPIGLRGYFVYQPAAALQRYMKTGPIRLVERDAHGTVTDTQLLQPPIVVAQSSSISPRRVRGQVFIRAAHYVGVEVWELIEKPFFSFQQGPVQLVRVSSDGRFVWRAPKSAPRRFEIHLSVLDSHFRPLVDLGD